MQYIFWFFLQFLIIFCNFFLKFCRGGPKRIISRFSKILLPRGSSGSPRITYIYILHNATRVGRNPMLRADSLHAYTFTCVHVYMLTWLHAYMLAGIYDNRYQYHLQEDWKNEGEGGWLAGWMAGWLTGWLVGWLADWMVGWASLF